MYSESNLSQCLKDQDLIPVTSSEKINPYPLSVSLSGQE